MKSAKTFWLAIICSFIWCSTGFAKSNLPIDAMNQALVQWMEKHRVKNATLTVFDAGGVSSTKKNGNDSGEVFALASLSKSITGACIAHLVANSDLRFQSTMQDVFGENLIALGLKDSEFGNLSISDLLTQTAGIAPDSTQKAMPKWMNKAPKLHKSVSATALGRKREPALEGKFNYNNENYAILGAVIEEQTNQSYYEYCANSILAPKGVTTAKGSGKYGAYAAWGGWEMNHADFVKFVLGTFGAKTRVGSAPLDFPHTEFVPNVYYGMGTFVRATETGNNFWHHGLICIGRKHQDGSFFAFWRGRLGVLVSYDKCLNQDAMIELDIVLGRASSP